MQVTRQHVVDILRMAALPELAEEADRVLPDPVEYDHESCRIEWEFYSPSSPTVLAGLDRVFTFISSRGTESPWWADR